MTVWWPLIRRAVLVGVGALVLVVVLADTAQAWLEGLLP